LYLRKKISKISKKTFLKTLLASVISLFYLSLNAGVGVALPAKTGDTEYFKVELKSTPERPIANKSTKYIVKVLDIDTGKPVNSASLKLKASMNKSGGGGHNMPGMGGEDETSELAATFLPTNKDGVYEAKIDFNMKGEWQALVEGDAEGKPINMGLGENVIESASSTSPGNNKPNWIVIGSFLAVIVGVFTLLTNKKRTKASEIANTEKLLPTTITAEDEA
jgi:hypothetical protein